MATVLVMIVSPSWRHQHQCRPATQMTAISHFHTFFSCSFILFVLFFYLLHSFYTFHTFSSLWPSLWLCKSSTEASASEALSRGISIASPLRGISIWKSSLWGNSIWSPPTRHMQCKSSSRHQYLIMAMDTQLNRKSLSKASASSGWPLQQTTLCLSLARRKAFAACSIVRTG